MPLIFALIFWAAKCPMHLIDHLFVTIGTGVRAMMLDDDLRSVIANSVIGGVGGVLVSCRKYAFYFRVVGARGHGLFVARRLVMDKVMRRFGLPSKAFVPMLSAHACAIPAIMSTRVIEDPRDRLLAVLITPLMTCSARVPVYAMVAALLFPNSPLKAAAVFTAASAPQRPRRPRRRRSFLQRTIPASESETLMIELSSYRLRIRANRCWPRSTAPKFSWKRRHHHLRIFARSCGASQLY